MTKKDYKKWVKRLKKYWKMREIELTKFLTKERKIEKLMQKEIGEQLEFIYTDEGTCSGIGHEDWGRRNHKRKDYFPLILGLYFRDRYDPH